MRRRNIQIGDLYLTGNGWKITLKICLLGIESNYIFKEIELCLLEKLKLKTSELLTNSK